MIEHPIKKFSLSTRSLGKLQGLDPRLINVIQRAINITSIDFTVIEGLRTYERQQELFAERKTRTLKSKHLTGHAVDVLPVGADWSKPQQWLPVLNAIKYAADELDINLRFGYTWSNSPDAPEASFLDAPHVEIDD